MSRIGRMPITIPAGVDVTIAEGNVVTVKGAKATLTQTFNTRLTIEKEADTLVVKRPTDEKEDRAIHGLTRALLQNMVTGVTEGFKKELQINGVGYKAAKQGTTLVLNLGHSHDIKFEEKDGITFEVPNPNTVIVHGAEKQTVGQIAAQIREKRPPEPYLGKGVKYADEHIRRKAGKASK